MKAVLEKHQDVFQEGTGTIQDYKAHIHMKENAQPKFHKARPVPYAMQENLELELTRLQEENNITKVEHSDWSAPIVVVPKTNKTVRICGDFKVTINPNVEREHYPLPKVEDLQCYAPTNDASDVDKERFYDVLHGITTAVPKHDMFVVPGDMNAKIGADNKGYKNVMGTSGCGEMNENGFLFEVLSDTESCNRWQYISAQGHPQVNVDVTKWSYQEPN